MKTTKFLIPIISMPIVIGTIVPLTVSCNKINPTPATSFKWEIQDGKAVISEFIGDETKVVIPSEYVLDGKTYPVTEIEQEAFLEKNITDLSIPSSIEKIDDGAFLQCSALENITVDQNNKIYTSHNAKNENCNCIVEIETKTLILGCQSTIIPENVTIIGRQSFHSCEKLTQINIPNNVTEIKQYAFCKTGLKQLDIPNNVKIIGMYSFSNCTELTQLTLGNGIKKILEQAFNDCNPNLTEATYNADTAAWNNIETLGSNWNGSIKTIHCTDGDITLSTR